MAHTEKHSRPRVLLVDDDPIFCRTMAKLADERFGAQLSVCRSVEDLSALPEKPPYDVAIVDYFFGEFTAPQIAPFLGAGTPMVVTSGSRREELEKEGMPRGGRHFVAKSQGMNAILQEALNVAAPRAAASPAKAPASETPVFTLRIITMVLLSLFLLALGISFIASGRRPDGRTFQWDQAPVKPNIMTGSLPSQRKVN